MVQEMGRDLQEQLRAGVCPQLFVTVTEREGLAQAGEGSFGCAW